MTTKLSRAAMNSGQKQRKKGRTRRSAETIERNFGAIEPAAAVLRQAIAFLFFVRFFRVNDVNEMSVFAGAFSVH